MSALRHGLGVFCLNIGVFCLNTRGRIMRAVLPRIATAQMRHAAFLLGEDSADGYGSGRGILRHLPEFGRGFELGCEYRYGSGSQIARALELRKLERSMLTDARKGGAA